MKYYVLMCAKIPPPISNLFKVHYQQKLSIKTFMNSPPYGI